jgi:hypothetical protein
VRAHYRNMADDEAKIAKAYRKGRLMAGAMAMPFVGFYIGGETGARTASDAVSAD